MTGNPVSISLVATAFTTTGAVIGVPSTVVLILYGLHDISTRIKTPAANTNFGDNPDAILLILKGFTDSIGALAHLAESIGQFLFNGLAIAAAVGLVLAVAFWFTGRGLGTQAHWARISAFILLVLALLPSLLLALTFHNVGRLLMLALTALFLLALHSIWTGYPTQTP